MKTTNVLLFISCNLLIQCVTPRSKYNEDGEDNPYEFGFTIDGQQHRHEKKDVNGIIQGEFGFITADGVYHVTVYATDENGNFKILSMRNVRISGPLDQPNAQLPDTSQFGKDVPKKPAAPPVPNPLSIGGPGRPIQAITQRPADFTTQPTIKPACAGCGYVTQKSPQDRNTINKLAFQTQAFNNPKPGSVVIGGAGLPSVNQNQNGNNRPYGNNNNFPPSGGASKFQGGNQDRFQSLNNAGVNGGNTFGNNGNNQGNPPPKYPLSGRNPADYVNPLSIPNSVTDRPPKGIQVSKGEIVVPNNPPIPIQDKYPNMVDGLPAGIGKEDITGILYKFNYTIGFHGHYEKGYKSGAKVGGYFVTDRDGVSRIVTYVADENGYRPKVKFIRLDLNSDLVPKEGTEKTFGLKNFEFVWYPLN